MLNALLVAASFALGASADSVLYPVYNHERLCGSMIVKHVGDTTTVRYVFTDRNRGSRDFVRYVSHNGALVSIERRPVGRDDVIGDATARIELTADSVRRWTPEKMTSERRDPAAIYSLFLSPYDDYMLAERLLREPSHTVKTAHDTTAHLAVLRELDVPTPHGVEHVRMVGLSTDKVPDQQILWLDARNQLFSTAVDWFITVKPGAERALPLLRKAEFTYRNATAESLNARVVSKTAPDIVIANGDVFDAERGVMMSKTTVVMHGDRITAVGPAESTPTPAGATVIDATGKTVMPGMWDMHGHLALESQTGGSPMQLARGITTVRDLASDIDVATSHRARANAGQIAAPRDVLAGFVEGPLAWAGPTNVFVSTEADARNWVATYDSLGYKQIKIYNVVHPDLVPTIVAEAHKRGMRVSGHIPRGLSVPAAVQLGFDEIQHAAFFFSTFFPDSLFVPTMRAYSQVASVVAANVDVDGAPMTHLIATLQQHHTVVDGTWAVWVVSAGTTGAQTVGAGVQQNATKADSNYIRLLKKMYDAGITLVPGTDEYGSMTYNTELELYERAGMPAPAILQSATLVSARVMRDDKDYGSVTPGKIADVIIVNGRPSEHIADLRKVEHVFRAGRLYHVQALRDATGFPTP